MFNENRQIVFGEVLKLGTKENYGVRGMTELTDKI